MRRILVIDDDDRIRTLLAEYLGGRGFDLVTAEDGQAGLEALRASVPDLVVLDVMMPGLDGLGVLRELRAFSKVPVIMLTARGDDMDRIVGLELGADDYLGKPFNPRELVARIEAVLRRAGPQPASAAGALRAGPLLVDDDRRVVELDGVAVDLTTTEFEILRVLVANAGRVIPRDRLMELARGEDYAAFDRSVDVHVSHIRRKLGDDSRDPTFVKTVRGVGYTVPRDPR
ncbi:MAG: response regulator transcription factor [Deltaproteobacteria bacterium]|nr:MAG: response regulator transcription factor [Deltaproteobacteria bacterium]